MADNRPRLIINSKSLVCKRCTGEHEFLTRLSDDVRCDVPVAYSLSKARKIARLMAGGDKDIVTIPEADMLVVLDDSARRLPHNNGEVPLAQAGLLERMM